MEPRPKIKTQIIVNQSLEDAFAMSQEELQNEILYVNMNNEEYNASVNDFNENDFIYASEDSDPKLEVNLVGESIGQGSDTDDVRVIDINSNLKGKRFKYRENGIVKLKENRIFIDVYGFR